MQNEERQWILFGDEANPEFVRRVEAQQVSLGLSSYCISFRLFGFCQGRAQKKKRLPGSSSNTGIIQATHCDGKLFEEKVQPG